MPLTEPQIMSLEAGPEADALVAEHVAGWRWFCREGDEHCVWLMPPNTPRDQMFPVGPLVQCERPQDADRLVANGRAFGLRRHPEWSADLVAAHEMESELERRGLAGDYAKQMRFMLMKGPNAPKDLDAWEFALIHASPLARVQAALLCVAKETK